MTISTFAIYYTILRAACLSLTLHTGPFSPTAQHPCPPGPQSRDQINSAVPGDWRTVGRGHRGHEDLLSLDHPGPGHQEDGEGQHGAGAAASHCLGRAY